MNTKDEKEKEKKKQLSHNVNFCVSFFSFKNTKNTRE